SSLTLTTSPARSARHTSTRIVRGSSLAVVPSREISSRVGSTRQGPIRKATVPTIFTGGSRQTTELPSIIEAQCPDRSAASSLPAALQSATLHLHSPLTIP